MKILPRLPGPPLGERLVDLVDEGRLADPGVTGHQQQFRAPARRALERRQERRNLPVPPVQALRDEEPVREVRASGDNALDPARCLPLRETPGEVLPEPEPALVAVFGRFGEQLHHNVRQGSGDGAVERARRQRHPRDVTMHDLQRVRRLERQLAGQHLVERDPERVEVGPIIHVAVHPARLLGRHVRDGALQHAGLSRLPLLEGQPRSDAEIDERGASGRPVDEDIVGVGVVVNDAALVQRGDGIGELHGQPERRAQIEPPRGEQRLQALTAAVLENEHHPVPRRRQAVGPGHAG